MNKGALQSWLKSDGPMQERVLLQQLVPLS